MNVLILGGTQFLGKHVTDALLEKGHRVAHFNRGLREPLPREGVERIQGDRDANLDRLGDRTWDAIVDTSCYKPQTAEASARYFADRAGRYLFVSTVSVHDLAAESVITEDTPVALEPREEYGPAKARCEAIVRSTFRHRAAIVRPGLIVGPHDPTDRFTYWPVRIAAGGEVLAPVAPSEPAQFIDARDLAQFIVHVLECGDGGTYDVTSARGRYTMGEVLEACARASASGAHFTWLDDAFLTENDVAQWSDLPLWVGTGGGARSIVNVEPARALVRGLSIRPLDRTVRDTLAWARGAGRTWGSLHAGLSPEREAKILQRWRARTN